MKRLTMLAVALVMVLGMAVSASAAPEVAISGNILINAVWKENWALDDETGAAALELYQRSDLYFTITANENLKGVLGLRSIRGEWGQGNALLGAPGGGGWTLGIRDAFIEFAWPGTELNVKAGVYTVALPAQVGGGSFILGDRAGAVMVSTPFNENVSLLAGFTRLEDNNTTALDNDDLSQVDAWLAALPLSFEGFSATPYFLYASGGMNRVNIAPTAGETMNGYWVGSDFSMSMFDPFIIKGDLLYSSASSEDKTLDASGWLFALGLDYTGFDWATLETYFIYTTGEDDDGAQSERVVVLAEDFAPGSFFFGGGSVTGDDIGNHPVGFWAIGASLTGIQSFAEGLTHDAHILYANGTNDDNAAGLVYGADLVGDDKVFEMDFNTAYSIYDELTLYAQLGYVAADYDDEVWGAGNNGGDAYKLATGIVYLF